MRNIIVISLVLLLPVCITALLLGMKYSPSHAPVRNADGEIMPGDRAYNSNYFEYEPVVLSARIVGEFNKIPMLGDLWLSTWASDDNLYVSWGDGTGMGYCYPAVVNDPFADTCLFIESCDPPEPIVFCEDFCDVFDCDGVTCYPPCTLTAAGLFRLEGHVNEFSGCDEECHMSIHIPTGIPLYEFGVDPGTRRDDKPSSLLAIDNTLYWSGHEPSGEAQRGYIAFSEDYGSTWIESPDSPWTEISNFRILMFINMGRNYELNEDGYVYGLGIGEELHEPPMNQLVYLARVPRDSIIDYSAYSYFTGRDFSGTPQWSSDQYQAVPLDNLMTVSTGAVMYHPGIGRYFFLALPGYENGFALTLYEAPNPWGPWVNVQIFEGHAFIPGIISKDTGLKSFYFTASGNTISYQLNIGRIEMTTRPIETYTPARSP